MKQGAAAGAALRFLQAGTAPRRKNRLSARGFAWYHRRPGPLKALPTVKSCALSEAPGLRPCIPFPAPIERGFFYSSLTNKRGWGLWRQKVLCSFFSFIFHRIPPGCGTLFLLRGTEPACKKQTAARYNNTPAFRWGKRGQVTDSSAQQDQKNIPKKFRSA